MRIRQVIVTVFEESSFIKRANHLPAVKNKTGTLIYCRLAETWSFSSLYENQGVVLNKARGKHSARVQHWSRQQNGAIIVMYFYMWHVGTGRDHWVFFSITKEHKKFARSSSRGSGIQTATWESRWGSWRRYCACMSIPAVRDTAAVVVRKESLLLNAGETLELSHDRQLQSFLSQDWHDAKSLFCPSSSAACRGKQC